MQIAKQRCEKGKKVRIQKKKERGVVSMRNNRKYAVMGTAMVLMITMAVMPIGTGMSFGMTVKELETEEEDTDNTEDEMVIEDGVLVKYTGSEKEVEIPDNVIVIGESAFADCDSIESIFVPGSVEKIEDYAFYGCRNLVNVDMEEGVTSIGYAAFYKTNLESVDLPFSMSYLGEYSFSQCSNLTDITIENGVISIGEGAFYLDDRVTIYCCSGSYVQQYAIDRQINYVLMDDETETSEPTITETPKTTKIPTLKPTKTPNITLEPTETPPTEEPLETKEPVTTLEPMENGLIVENETVIGYVGEDSTVIIPDEIINIGDKAFSGKTNISVLVLPEGIENIGQEAFANCTGLSNVIIPSSVVGIEKGAFSGCTNLRNIILPEDINELKDGTFSDCTNLKNVVLPQELIKIGQNVFLNCDNLQSIVLTDNLDAIGKGAFSGCSSLSDIRLPETVSSIGENAFYNCDNLASVIISRETKEIGKSAFDNCPCIIIYGERGSYAETYAGWYGIAFISTDEDLEDEDLEDDDTGEEEVKVTASPVKLSAPVKVACAESSGKYIKISWKKVTKANKYYVYRSTKKNSGYKKIKAVSSNYLLDQTVKKGIVYYYKVIAHGTGNYKDSGYSKIISGMIPKEPIKLTVKKGPAASIKISWKKDKSNTAYEIYSMSGKKGTYKKIAVCKGNKYTNKKLSGKKTYYYKVRAYKTMNGKKYYSSWSNVKKITLK